MNAAARCALVGLTSIISIAFEPNIARAENQLFPFYTKSCLEHVTERTEMGLFKRRISDAATNVIMKNAVNNRLAGGYWIFATSAIESSSVNDVARTWGHSAATNNSSEAVTSCIFVHCQAAPIFIRGSFDNPILGAVSYIYSWFLSRINENNLKPYNFPFFNRSHQIGIDWGNPCALGKHEGVLSLNNAPYADCDKKNCCDSSPEISGAKIFNYALTLVYFIFGFALIIFCGVFHSILSALVRWPASLISLACGCTFLYLAFERVVPIF